MDDRSDGVIVYVTDFDQPERWPRALFDRQQPTGKRS
jgi:hypothetical protein